MKKKLVLIDTMGIIHRAFHAYPQLTTTDGKLVNAVYGFAIMFLQILKTIKPEYVVFATDLKEKTFRSEKYADYKAQRGPMDEGLVSQIPLIYDFINSTGLPLFSQNGYEADDIIGSLATKYSKDFQIEIITGDKDLLQLINDDVAIILPGKTFSDMRVYHEKEFVDRFGFSPKEYIDFKAIIGDPSDNIKGAKGIGDKTATSLIKDYHTLGGILENLDNIKERYRKIIEEYRETLITNLDIVTIHKEVELDLDIPKSELKKLDLTSVVKFLKDLEFHSILTQLQKLNINGESAADVIEEMDDKKEIKFHEHKSDAMFDEELPYFLRFEDKTFCFNEKYQYKIQDSLPKSGAGFDIKYIYRDSSLHKNKFDDLQLLAYCMNPEYGDTDVYKIYKKLFHKEIPNIYSVSIKDEEAKDIAMQAIAFIEIYNHVKKNIGKKENEVYTNIDLPVLPVIARMENAGINVHSKYLSDLESEFDKKIKELKQKLFDSVGHEFNPNSPKELSHILFEELQLPKMKKIKTGFSTNERTISKLLGTHPIIELILEYREYTKLQSTYVIGLQKLIVDGKIHTELRQTTVATGRLSSINPNLQNIPTRSETGELIRKAFTARKGSLLLSMDYSQIELRLMAEISGDKDFTQAFVDGKDIHTNTASLMFDIPEEDVTKEQRRVAKMINFGIIYGISDFGLSDRLGNGIDVKQAKEFIKKYFERYPKVKEYFDSVKEKIETDGYVETMFGRRRYFNLSVGNYMLKQAMYREAINMPIQGADADIVKMAMVKVQNLIDEKYSDKVIMLLQIHDELLFDIKDDEKTIDSFTKDAKELMENVVKLKVPMVVNSKIGENWGEMK